MALLDDDERARSSAFGSPSRRAEFLAGRLAAKLLIASMLGIDARRASITLDPEGKPGAEGGIRLSIAHSGGVALCAAARFGLGADIERASSRRHIDSIAGFAFSEAERDGLRGPGREERFFALWTLKEAHLKRLGLGLGSIRDAPAFELGPGATLAAVPDAAGCGYLCLALGASHVASIAHDRLHDAPELAFLPSLSPPEGLKPRALYATGPGGPRWAR
jgi:4'-phosphopantetheinyl transferase